MAVTPPDNGAGPESPGVRPEHEKAVAIDKSCQDVAPAGAVAKEGAYTQAQAQVQQQQQQQEQEQEQEQPPLPFSKARCIALVATVTGAAFLNVSPVLRTLCIFLDHLVLNVPLTRSSDPFFAMRRHYPAHNRRGPIYPREQAAVDCVILLSRFWLLSPHMGAYRRCLWEALHLHCRLTLGHCHHGSKPFCAQ
jgi:hypothetical protein